MNRVWDPQNKYKTGVLKEYNHWVLEISFRQHTLGCFIIFAKRDIDKISELSDEELSELKNVMVDMEVAITKIFQADRFNYLQLGNSLHRLHFHGVPRYQAERVFNGRKWIDKTFGHPPIWSKEEVSEDLVKAIKEKLLPVV